jgi:hypothetical protein
MARDQIKYFETMQISTPSTTVKLLLKGTKSLLKSLQSTQPTSGKSLQEKANGVQVNSSIFFMYLRLSLAGIGSLPPTSSQKLWTFEAPAVADDSRYGFSLVFSLHSSSSPAISPLRIAVRLVQSS